MKINKQYSTPEVASRDLQLRRYWPGIRLIASSVIVVTAALLGAPFSGAEDLRPLIRVRVDNYAQASPGTMAGAEREASRILFAAGLQAVWLDCPVERSLSAEQDPCQEPLEPTDIVLRVISNSIQNKAQDAVFGFAVLPILASVYFDYPARLARSANDQSELHVILGCVIAHEIGHLLLGSNSHIGSGIMQPRWEGKQVRQAMTGALLFTPAQAKSLQIETQKRMRLQTAHLSEPK